MIHSFYEIQRNTTLFQEVQHKAEYKSVATTVCKLTGLMKKFEVQLQFLTSTITQKFSESLVCEIMKSDTSKESWQIYLY